MERVWVDFVFPVILVKIIYSGFTEVVIEFHWVDKLPGFLVSIAMGH